MFDAVIIARYIVDRCTRNNSLITNLKLQKLLYYVWIDYYKATGNYLFSNYICAWPLGPVVADAYDEFCVYGGLTIRKRFDNLNIGEYEKSLIDQSIDKLMRYSASELVNKSHAAGKPWALVFNNGAGRGRIISFELIIKKECS